MAYTPEEVLKFYNGNVTLLYDSSLHAYYVLEDGVKYLVPGASTVCGIIDKSGPLTQWAANCTVQFIRENVGKLTRYIDLDGLKGDFLNTADLEALLNDARFNYRKISQDAKDTGTLAHEWLQAHSLSLIHGTPNEPLPEDVKACNCIAAALKWMDIHKFKPEKAENKIYSREFGYAGTFDWVGIITACGVKECCPFTGILRMLGDYKSSKALYEEYRAQTASYKLAYNEERSYLESLKDVPPWESQQVQGRVLLRLGKDDGEFEPCVMLDEEEYERDLDGFLGALQVYNWMKQFQLDEKGEKMKERALKKAAKEAAKVGKTARRKVRKPVAPVDDLIPIGE